VLTEPSTDALSCLYSIEYKQDYPQIQIILKKPQASQVKRMFGGFFEDNIFHWWYSLTVQI